MTLSKGAREKKKHQLQRIIDDIKHGPAGLDINDLNQNAMFLIAELLLDQDID